MQPKPIQATNELISRQQAAALAVAGAVVGARTRAVAWRQHHMHD